MFRSLLILSCGLLLTQMAYARPYPAASGIAAAADTAAVAANNPAGMTRFDSLNMRFEALGFFSESTWEGRIGDTGPTLVELANGEAHLSDTLERAVASALRRMGPLDVLLLSQIGRAHV